LFDVWLVVFSTNIFDEYYQVKMFEAERFDISCKFIDNKGKYGTLGAHHLLFSFWSKVQKVNGAKSNLVRVFSCNEFNLHSS